MKKKFVFDSMESDFSDIIEETIIENTGVNTERVVNTVMKATTAKKIRRFTKRGIIGIAAAVAAAVIISTVSVGAAGGFNQVFGNWFAGQPKYGLFAGSNVSIKSDNLDIDFQGIAGEDNFAGAVMEVKNKDGSAFFEKNDGKYLIYGAGGVEVTVPPIAQLFRPNSVSSGGGVWFKEKDENTIQVSAFYGNSYGYVKGERMTIKETQLYIVHLDEAVGIYTDSYDELTEKYKDRLGENQIIFEYSESGDYEDNIYYIATEKTVPFELEIGVTLNYRTYSRTMNDLNGQKFSMNDVTLTVNKLYAKSFGIEMDATISEIPFPEMPEYDENDPIANSYAIHDYHEKLDAIGLNVKLDITLKDGSKLTATASSKELTYKSDSSSTGIILCSYMKDGLNIAIDPDEIESITATAAPLEKY